MPPTLCGVPVHWSACYRPEWDDAPEEYTRAGVLAPGRSRRLARVEDAARAFKGYLGVHSSPAAWPDLERTRFFLSLFVGGATVSLRTYATCAEARDALAAFLLHLPAPDAP